MSKSTPPIIPTHLGLILDGNRRWAKAQNLPQLEGHRKGYEIIKNIGEGALKQGVKYVSVYVFSTENWNRSQEEVSYLMKLLLWLVKNDLELLHKNNIRLRFLGSQDRLNNTIIRAIKKAEATTKKNTSSNIFHDIHLLKLEIKQYGSEITFKCESHFYLKFGSNSLLASKASSRKALAVS